MLHTANCDDNFDPTSLKVAVLGYGSTGVQITPAIQSIVKQLDHYVRGKVWVPPGGGTNSEELIERNALNNCKFPNSRNALTQTSRTFHFSDINYRNQLIIHWRSVNSLPRIQRHILSSVRSKRLIVTMFKKYSSRDPRHKTSSQNSLMPT
jgi:cation diffusion facilitator CzcD-associated flavoprotein CzcO